MNVIENTDFHVYHRRIGLLREFKKIVSITYCVLCHTFQSVDTLQIIMFTGTPKFCTVQSSEAYKDCTCRMEL